MNHLRPALSLLLFFTVLTGLVYPLTVTGLADVFFPAQAHGSLIERDGRVIGSALIGQNFTSEKYFHGRPSAAGAGYDAAASSGSNLGPTSKALSERIAAAQTAQPGAPLQLLTTSASGLDPHISPDAARYQLARIAAARGLDPEALSALIASHSEPRLLGVLGEPVVNVLRLNLALDALKAP